MKMKTVAILTCAALMSACGQKVAAPYPTPDVSTAHPAFPVWAEPLIGKRFQEIYPTLANCEGATDVITMHYTGAPAGYQIEGWGWDVAASKPVDRILLVSNGVVVGAGEGGRSRADVTKVNKKVTSPMVGWQAVSADFSGKLETFGVLGANACALGEVTR